MENADTYMTIFSDDDLKAAYYHYAACMIGELKDGRIEEAVQWAANIEAAKVELGQRGISIYPIDACMSVGADLAAE